MAYELFHASVVELCDKLARKEVSAVELAQVYLDRIEQNKDLNAFLKDNRVIVSALRTAKDLDATDEEWQDFIDKLRKSREGKP